VATSTEEEVIPVSGSSQSHGQAKGLFLQPQLLGKSLEAGGENDETNTATYAPAEDELQLLIRKVQKLSSLSIDPSFKEDLENFDHDADLDMLHESVTLHGQASGFQCMEEHDGNPDNPNARTIALLQELANWYDRMGDKWRTTAYRKGIASLRKQTKLIQTKKEAQSIPGIGERMAEKIEEIVTFDRCRRLEYAQQDPNDQILQLFMGVYGAGYATASRWVAQGHRTLDGLYRDADLNKNQRIGIDHYEDFLQRIPRSEVAQHGEVVKQALSEADPSLQMLIGGSYRRGSPDSGDIDLIITKNDATLEHIHTLMMESVIPSLTQQGFLKAALATGHAREATSSKWHGASCLPGSTIWRRIDLLFVPWAELGAALIYFTGNDIFNRSIRLLASEKQMRLNQHGLFKDVMRGRGREKLTDGTLLEGHSEKRIFEILGVPYWPPHLRVP
jgi:DNA polymerase IV